MSMLMMSKDHVELRLSATFTLIPTAYSSRHLSRHDTSAILGHSAVIPRKTTRAQRSRCTRWIHAVLWASRSLGFGSRDRRLARSVAPQPRQAPRSWERQNVNKQTTTTQQQQQPHLLPASCRLPRRRFPTTSFFYATPFHRLKLYSLEQAPSCSTPLQCGRFRPGATGLC